MSSFNLYDILPDKSKEALQSLFKREEVVQTKPKPQSKIKKASPTPVAKKKLSKTPQSFRPTKGGHRNMRETLNSEHVPESLQQLYIDILDRKGELNKRKKKKKKKRKKYYDFVENMYERTDEELRFEKKGDKKKANRERIAKSGQVRTIETTSSINAISIPMGGLNKRW